MKKIYYYEYIQQKLRNSLSTTECNNLIQFRNFLLIIENYFNLKIYIINSYDFNAYYMSDLLFRSVYITSYVKDLPLIDQIPIILHEIGHSKFSYKLFNLCYFYTKIFFPIFTLSLFFFNFDKNIKIDQNIKNKNMKRKEILNKNLSNLLYSSIIAIPFFLIVFYFYTLLKRNLEYEADLNIIESNFNLPTCLYYFSNIGRSDYDFSFLFFNKFNSHPQFINHIKKLINDYKNLKK